MKTNEIYLSAERIDRHIREGSWPGLLWSDLAERAARAFPNKTACIDARGRYTYTQFTDMVNKISLALIEAGVGRGDVVGVGLASSAEYMASVLGITQIGGVYVPFSYQFREADLEPLAGFTEPAAVIVPFEFRGFQYIPMYHSLQKKLKGNPKTILVSGAPAGTAGGDVVSLDDVLKKPLDAAYAADYLRRTRPSPMDLAAIQFTSGTTGRPKGAMHTHDTWISGAIWQWGQLAVRPDDIMMNLHPLFGAAGLTHTTAMLYNKSTIIFPDKFDPEDALRTMEKEEATILVGVAAHFIDILNHPNFGKYDLSHLRLCYSVGGPVTSTLAKQVEEKMGCRISLLWGASEFKGGTQTLLTDHDDTRLTTVGRVVPYMEIKAVDPSGKEVPNGQPGELLARGCSSFVGYYKDPDITKSCVDAEGWFHTGDVGVFDKLGNLTVTGRIKDMISRGGEKIYPKDIEDLLAAHPRIKDCAIVAAPHPRLGEMACAYIIPKKPGDCLTVEDLLTFLKGKIQTHKIPERVEMTDLFPKTDAGKVIKDKLKADVRAKMVKEGKIPA